MASMGKVVIHMVSSLDGFVASSDGSLDWMHSSDHFEHGKQLTDEDISAYLDQIDCYVMGSKTYEQALELGWPYGEKPVFVATSQALTSDQQSVNFSNDNLSDLLTQLKQKFSSIWLVGGPSLTKSCIEADMADEIVLSIMPVILGGGQLFFDFVGRTLSMHLLGSTPYSDGMVELHYEIRRS